MTLTIEKRYGPDAAIPFDPDQPSAIRIHLERTIIMVSRLQQYQTVLPGADALGFRAYLKRECGLDVEAVPANIADELNALALFVQAQGDRMPHLHWGPDSYLIGATAGRLMDATRAGVETITSYGQIEHLDGYPMYVARLAHVRPVTFGIVGHMSVEGRWLLEDDAAELVGRTTRTLRNWRTKFGMRWHHDKQGRLVYFEDALVRAHFDRLEAARRSRFSQVAAAVPPE